METTRHSPRPRSRVSRAQVLVVALATLGAAACATATAQPADDPARARADRIQPLDARLTGYPYPFEVHRWPFQAQGGAQELAYMDVQPEAPNGHAVLLLHGKNFSGAYWGRTARDLAARGYRVVIPDQLGFGKSSKPTCFQYSFHAMAQHTRALLDALGVSKVSVVGHSMGGMLATRFALLFPDRVERLALVNPIGLEDWQEKVPYVPVDHWYEQALAQTPDGVRRYMQESYFDGQWAPEYEALAALQTGWAVSPDRERLARVSSLTYDMVFTQPVVHDFPRVAVPTLLIIGTRDRTALGKALVSPEVRETLGRYDRLGRAARDAIPRARLVELEGVGHIPQVEAYDAYLAALVAHLPASER